MITLGTVNISEKTKKLMQEALDKGIIGQGKYIGDFEKSFADFLGVKHAVAVSSGTMADACALAAIKEKNGSKRDEVIVTALTFIAQINAIHYNHLKPVFVDVKDDFQIDVSKIEEKITSKTLAIMPTHLLGKPANMEKITALAKKYNLYVVEDACEALGSKYDNKFCGTIGDLGCFSFFVSHSITTGEGGMVVTNDDELAELVRSLRNHGRKGEKPEEKFIFPRIGFSAKMNSLEAIIGLGVMEELPLHIERRHQNMVKAAELLGFDFFCDSEKEYTVPHGLPIMVESEEKRNLLLKILPEYYGIEVRQIFYSIPTQSQAYEFFDEEKGSYPVAEDIGKRGLYFPCHQNLDMEDIKKITVAISEIKKTNFEKNAMENYKIIKKCRICGSSDLTEVIYIDPQFLSPTFVKSNENNELSKIKVPMTLLLCDKTKNFAGCGLLQLKETVNPDLLYRNYFYRTIVSDTMCKDLKEVVEDVENHVQLNEGDSVVDIGANDCTMLGYFPKNLNRIGVEPAKNINWDGVDSSIKIINDYFSKKAVESALKLGHVKAITSCAMFYDLDDPNSFVSDVKSILAPGGIWCIQLSYLPLMIKNMNFYDICNEHLEYYSLHSLRNLMERHNLSIFDASTNGVNGGSARVFIAHEEDNREQSENLKKLLAEELEMKLEDVSTYKNFYKKIVDIKNVVNCVMTEEINKGNLVLGLGASTKGNVLLQFFGITKETLPYISERNPDKVGLRTLGSDIELISEEKARNLNPSYMLVLPWYFKNEIVAREKEYLEKGGKLFFPMPYPHVVTKDGEINLAPPTEEINLKNKKILVAGGAGFLGKFVVKKLIERGVLAENIFVPEFGKYDLRKMEDCVRAVQGKDIVINLAARIGGIEYSDKNPGLMFYDNVVLGVQLMEAARLANVEKFIVMGSVCAYPKFGQIPFREEDLWGGYPEETNAPYGIAKRILIAQGQAYKKQYGFNAVSLVMVNLYGPGDNFNPESSHAIPALIKKVAQAKKKGESSIEAWGTGNPTREFLYVEDAAEGIISAVVKYNNSEPVNLGSGMEISIKDLVGLICKLMNFNGEIKWDLSKPDGQPRRLFDSSKAKERFGFKAETDFEEGLKKTIKWYEENLSS